ncbi:MAG TPA: BTAD domain-containing putative transcriptional regulator [Acidimicrobiales bacterium]|nr:BTAD domain-containing putative transcriptional regulator [Acidimicrobiales bacterium]
MEFRLLGPLEVVADDGTIVSLRGLKLRALIAVLALEAGHLVSSDRLIECLYGDELPQQAANALHLLVSKVRRALREAGADEVVVTRPPGYLLAVGPDQVDALRFAAMVADGRAHLEKGRAGEASATLAGALALWRGDALADFAYEEFAAPERGRLEELRRSAVEDRIEADLALGRHGECVDELRAMVAAHPFRERLWGMLMLALYRAGRQADALRAFQAARQTLGEELGIEPATELRALEAAILAQDPSLDLARPSPPPAAPAAAAAGNLPRPLTACIGRDDELVRVGEVLDRVRLVTLTGPGGTGKTRLAIEAALRVASGFPGGAWMVDLAGVLDGEGVVPAMRSSLGLEGAPLTAPPAQGDAAQLAETLGDRRMLVVLDNCEHLVAKAATAAEDLLSRCPGLTLLCTSREALGVPGEVLFAVPPLAPEVAARLFVERALAAAPDLVFDEAARVAVDDICARLDGLPLAIELAASRARALDVTQIAARLGDRFRLLSSGPRTAVPRQRTLRAVVDWSYDLLDPVERLVFERLTVFAAGATLEAAEAVCRGDGVDEAEVADVLARLVDKSLVTVDRSSGPARFTMLQTLVDYGAERLAEAGGTDAAMRRLGAWALDLARRAERPPVGNGRPLPLRLVADEAENIDAVLAWAVEHDPGLALETAGRLGWFWLATGRLESGWRALTRSLARTPVVDEAVRARALAWAGYLGSFVDDATAAAVLDEAVARARQLGDLLTLGLVLGIRGALFAWAGRPREAEPLLAESAACQRAAGSTWGEAIVGILQATAAMTDGRFDEADAFLRHSSEGLQATGDDWDLGMVLHQRAELAHRRGRPDEAAAAVEEIRASGGAISNRYYAATTFAHLTFARLAQGRIAEAAVAGEDAVAAARQQSHPFALGFAFHARGSAALAQGRHDQAEADLAVAVGHFSRRVSPHNRALCLSDFGRAAQARGDLAVALRRHADAARTAAEMTDPIVTRSALEGLALALALDGEPRRAGLVLGAARALADGNGATWSRAPEDARLAAGLVATQLGPTVLAQAQEEGTRLSLESLLAGL